MPTVPARGADAAPTAVLTAGPGFRSEKQVRIGLYLERLSVGFAAGTFLLLPLFFRSIGRDEVFFGEVYAAGALGTLLSVSLGAAAIKQFGLRRVAPVGSLFFTFGSALYVFASYATGSLYAFFLASFLQGVGWGQVFATGPICLSTTLCNLPESRKYRDASYFFATYAAFSQLGVGLAPFTMRILVGTFHWGYVSVFALGTAAAVIAVALSLLTSSRNTLYSSFLSGGASPIRDFWLVLKQPSIYFFAAIFLAGCIYTSMMNLQTTFAAAQGLDYGVFYTFYTFAVVFSRFALSRPISKLSPPTAMIALLAVMTAALASYIWADRSAVVYAIASLVLGGSYGLAYPVMQGQLTKYSHDELVAPTMMYFSLSYFVAVYLFPYVTATFATTYGYSVMPLLLTSAGAMELLVVVYFFRVVAMSPTVQAKSPKWVAGS
jgi:MFS family permease